MLGKKNVQSPPAAAPAYAHSTWGIQRVVLPCGMQMCGNEGLFVLFSLPLKHWGRSWMPLPWCSLWISATAASMADLQNEWFSQAASSTSYSSSRLPSSSACLPSSFTTSKNWQNPTTTQKQSPTTTNNTSVESIWHAQQKNRAASEKP